MGLQSGLEGCFDVLSNTFRDVIRSTPVIAQGCFS